MAGLVNLIQQLFEYYTTNTNEFIMHSALKNRPIFESYKRLCRTRGRKDTDYLVFEWRYYQFYNGNPDLTIDRGPEDSSPLTLFDLPMVVLRNVVKELNLVDRLILRKVSQNLRNLVDSTEARCDRLYFSFGSWTWSMQFEDWMIYYTKVNREFRRVSDRLAGKIKTVEMEEAREQAIVTDASTLLKNPVFKIRGLKIDVFRGNESHRHFFEFLKTLKFQLNVQSLLISASEDLIRPILQFLKPQYLEIIAMGAKGGLKHFEDFVEMEQWKKARKLRFLPYPKGFPADEMLHFKEIDIDGLHFNDENFEMIRDILLKSAHLELFSAHFFRASLRGLVLDDFRERMDQVMGLHTEKNSEVRRFSIANSRDYYQLRTTADQSYFILTITKVFTRRLY